MSDRQYTFDTAVEELRHGESSTEATQRLLRELSQDERLSLLDGDVPFWEGIRSIFTEGYNRVPYIHGEIKRLGIPGIRFTDGPRGIVMGASTAFPVSMARGATFDTSLEERVGEVIGLEGRAQGANFFAGVCINLPRHPAWGRIQETYGEDPLILGEFGAALSRSVRRHMIACIKHYALNSMENARFRVDVTADPATLHEVFLPHFKRAIDDGAEAVMSSYNSVNGEWAGQNRQLLTEILKEHWQFDGLVISDFIFGLRDAALSVKNGLDLEAPFTQQRAMHLPIALKEGRLNWADVDHCCERLLRKQIELYARLPAEKPGMDVVFCKEHRDLAREVAARSMVLLENRSSEGVPALPLDHNKPSRVAVLGRFANTANTGDGGSSAVRPPAVVTPYEGLKAALPLSNVLIEDSDDATAAAKLASEVDVPVLIVGYDAKDEGEFLVPSTATDPEIRNVFPPTDNMELLAKVGGGNAGDATAPATAESGEGLQVQGMGGDRKSLRLRKEEVELIKAVSAANSRAVVAVVAAGAVIMEEWRDLPAAILMSWYSGCEGGHALADVLLGKVDVSGRLPFSIPASEQHLPFFDAEARSITYDKWFGQHLLDRLNVRAAYPLGYGLSYTNFKLGTVSVKASAVPEILEAHVSVSNTGSRAGRCIVQVYGKVEAEDFPSRVLLGFRPVDLEAGERKDIDVQCSTRPLRKWTKHGFSWASERIVVEAAQFAGDAAAVSVDYTL